jgi:hypothetical protein
MNERAVTLKHEEGEWRMLKEMGLRTKKGDPKAAFVRGERTD